MHAIVIFYIFDCRIKNLQINVTKFVIEFHTSINKQFNKFELVLSFSL